jgi:hypothetical protein
MLGFNAAFVSLWVGAGKFGGHTLNSLLAANVILQSLVHGLFAMASVIGKRFQIGMATLLQGGLNIVLAVVLGRFWGLPGVAAACLLSSLLLAVPFGISYLSGVTGLTVGDMWRHVFASWSMRGIPMLAVGVVAGHWLLPQTLWLLLLCAPPMGTFYLWYMRPLYDGLPFPVKLQPLLARMRLIPQE